MNKSTMILALYALMADSSVAAEGNVTVRIGSQPPPSVVYETPPTIQFEVAPLFIIPARLGFYVGVDTPYDIIFLSDYFYLYYGNSWHRSSHHKGPWVKVPYRELPPGVRKYSIEKIRTYRWKENVAVDHRVEQSFHLQKLLVGELDELVAALEAKDVDERLERMG